MGVPPPPAGVAANAGVEWLARRPELQIHIPLVLLRPSPSSSSICSSSAALESPVCAGR
jgi:hypothetical protein